MKHSILLVSFLVSACVTPPLKPKFPEVPPELLEAPRPLKEVTEGQPADKIFDTVIDNYGLYHQLSDKYSKWQLWYENQKKIYNETQ